MCKYCENHSKEIEELEAGDIAIVQKARYIQVGSSIGAQSVPLNFCPNCGKYIAKNVNSEIEHLIGNEYVLKDIAGRICNYEIIKDRVEESELIDGITEHYSVTSKQAMDLLNYVRDVILK